MGVWWIGSSGPDAGLLHAVCARVGRVFASTAVLLEDGRRPADTLDARRGQHASGRILRFVAEARPRQRVLAVTDADLFVPVLTFVFGEAELGGHAAVVSTARLGRHDGPGLLRARLLKEAVHELGHTFGLVHCVERRCAMARSSQLADVDDKQAELCGDCSSLLRDKQREGAT
jgi:archaemetzincin